MLYGGFLCFIIKSLQIHFAGSIFPDDATVSERNAHRDLDFGRLMWYQKVLNSFDYSCDITKLGRFFNRKINVYSVF